LSSKVFIRSVIRQAKPAFRQVEWKILTVCTDEVDLHGHYKNLGSSKDFTHPDDITSWCVHKWEDAGAVIIGKLNMHELGVGMALHLQNPLPFPRVTKP